MKRATCLGLVFVLCFLSMAPSCNKATLEKAEQQSGKIATYANEVTNSVREMMRQNIISPQTASKLADKLIVVAKAGVAFDNLMAKLKADYGGLDKVPKSQAVIAFTEFRKVILAFIDVFVEFKAIPRLNQTILNYIDLIILSIKLISRAFNREPEVTAQLAAVGA